MSAVRMTFNLTSEKTPRRNTTTLAHNHRLRVNCSTTVSLGSSTSTDASLRYRPIPPMSVRSASAMTTRVAAHEPVPSVRSAGARVGHAHRHRGAAAHGVGPVSYTHLRAHETVLDL